jgi:hypothetical protein
MTTQDGGQPAPEQAQPPAIVPEQAQPPASTGTGPDLVEQFADPGLDSYEFRGAGRPDLTKVIRRGRA